MTAKAAEAKKGNAIRNEKGDISSTKILSMASGMAGVILALTAGMFVLFTGKPIPEGIFALVLSLLGGTAIRPLAAGVRGLTAKNGN